MTPNSQLGIASVGTETSHCGVSQAAREQRAVGSQPCRAGARAGAWAGAPGCGGPGWLGPFLGGVTKPLCISFAGLKNREKSGISLTVSPCGLLSEILRTVPGSGKTFTVSHAVHDILMNG